MVPVVAFDEIVRQPMSYEEFLELPDDVRAEWVDGEVLFMAPVSFDHSGVVGQLILVLGRQLHGVKAGPEAGVHLPRPSVRAPDVLLWPDRDQPRHGAWVEGNSSLLLAVEVLSRSTRTEDILRKPREYAAVGIQRYWIVDPVGRVIDALRLDDDDEWSGEASLDDDHPRFDFDFGEHGTATIELAEILGPPA